MSRRSSFKLAGVRKRAAEKAESDAADIGAPVVQGCLLKQSTGLVKRWQERFYVLEPPFLKYYTSGERKVLRGALDTTILQGVSLLSTPDGATELVLKLSTPDEEHGGTTITPLTLRSNTVGDAERWFEKLQEMFL